MEAICMTSIFKLLSARSSQSNLTQFETKFFSYIPSFPCMRPKIPFFFTFVSTGTALGS